MLIFVRSASISRFRRVGGVNSIDNFARSWQRAAHFPETLLRRGSFTAAESDDEGEYGTENEQAERSPLITGIEPEDTQDTSGDQGLSKRPSNVGPLGSSLDVSFGASYGTISSRVSDVTRKHAFELHKERQQHPEATGVPAEEPLLVKQVQHEDGTRENVIVGQSTVPQTIFNSVNVLIGVGLLSLPLAMKQAGWLIGLSFLLFSAITTSYTAKILAKCLDVDQSLVTYADVAYISFGHRARLVTSLLFCLELVGACVALVVLFADSLHALIPQWSTLEWKIICGIILVPLNFVPLRLLSVTSILGILSCTSSTYAAFQIAKQKAEQLTSYKSS